MRANTPGFVGERLIQARKSLRLSGIGLASLIDVSPTTISQYEKNKQSPRPEVMDRICEKFGLPLNFFTTPLVERGERKVLYRSLNAAAKSARERAEVRFEWLREITEYLCGYFDLPRLNIPQIELPADFRDITTAFIERAAQQCRDLWGFGSEPIPDLVLAMESNGVIVARSILDSEHLDAFSEHLADGFAYVVLGADKGVKVRSRFDAAHELGHLLLHRNVHRKEFAQARDFKILEGQSHRFAAAFLLPATSFVDRLWAPTLDAFRTEREYWGASIKGMVVRSHQLGLLPADQYQRTMISYVRRYRNGEPGDDVQTPEVPRLLARCFEALEANGVRSKEQILKDLPYKPSDIEELVGLPRGYFSKGGDLVRWKTPPVSPKSTNSAGTGIVVQFPTGGRISTS